jgi:hypothetical protein
VQTYFKILLIIVLSLALIIPFSAMVQKGQEKYRSHEFGRMKEIFEEPSEYDVLFIGSSRMHTTVYPYIVDSITGLKSFNAGVDGGNLFEFKMILEGYLLHHPPPRFLFISLDGQSFDFRKRIFFPLQYFPYTNNQAIKRAFGYAEDYKEVFITKMSFLRIIYYDDYSKMLGLKGWMGENQLKEENAFENKGFLSNGDNCVDSFKKYETSIQQIDKDAVDYFKEVISIARNHNIRLCLVYAPEYNFRYQALVRNFNEVIKTINDSKGKLPFYRDDSLDLCRNPCYFKNYGHVNIPGAVEYSKILGRRIDSLNKGLGRFGLKNYSQN